MEKSMDVTIGTPSVSLDVNTETPCMDGTTGTAGVDLSIDAASVDVSFEAPAEEFCRESLHMAPTASAEGVSIEALVSTLTLTQMPTASPLLVLT